MKKPGGWVLIHRDWIIGGNWDMDLPTQRDHVRTGVGDCSGGRGMLPWRWHSPGVVLSICFPYDGHDRESSCDPLETLRDHITGKTVPSGTGRAPDILTGGAHPDHICIPDSCFWNVR